MQQTYVTPKYRVCGQCLTKRRRQTSVLCTSVSDDVKYRSCTVVENRTENITASVRSLVLSVDDNVQVLQGRKISGLLESERWIDKYKVPGQYVFVKNENGNSNVGQNQNPMRFPISSSPYAVRAESAYLAASIIEILVENGNEEFGELAQLGPGGTLQVSEPKGNGFCSLYNNNDGLLSTMEEGLPLLMIGQGVRGIAALRSALEWTPVQAHAGNNKVTLMFLTPSRQDAPYVKDWDKWREAGMIIHPLFGQSHDGAGLIRNALVNGVEGSFSDVVGGRAGKLGVLFAGLNKKIQSDIWQLLMQQGVERERLLLSEFF